jgi:hypothetical protein
LVAHVCLGIRTTPDLHGWTIWKTLVLRSHLTTLGYLPESSGTAAWLKTLGYLAFLGKGIWLKSMILKECLTIPDYTLDYLV